MGKANGGNIQFEYLQLATTTADDDAIVYGVQCDDDDDDIPFQCNDAQQAWRIHSIFV